MSGTINPSFQNAIQELSRLPGIGLKTAERLVFHLIKQPKSQTDLLSDAIKALGTEVQYCKVCHNLSTGDECSICQDPRRNERQVLVVEMPQDLFRFEEHCDYQGRYHVLGGRYAPLEGLFPEDLNLDTLVRRLQTGTIEELILALNPTTEGEATCEWLKRELKKFSINITRLATGLPQGTEIEFSGRRALRDAFAFRRDF
jgi:recombination protein RecR